MLVAEIGSYFIDPKSQDYGSYRVVPLYGSYSLGEGVQDAIEMFFSYIFNENV